MRDWTDFLDQYKSYIPLFKKLLSDNLALKPDEEVIIISDVGTDKSTVADRLNHLYKAALDELGNKYKLVYQPVRIRGDIASPELITALSQLNDGSVIILNTSGRIGNLDKIGKSYRKFAKAHNHRFFSASNLSLIHDENFDKVLKAIDIDYQELDRIGKYIKEKLDKATTVRVTTEAGTDVTLDITGRTSINNNGLYKVPGLGGNMPTGEVYIAPTTEGVNGTIVIDGSYRTKDASIIPEEPIILQIEKGRIVSMNNVAESKALNQTLEWAEERAKHPWGIRQICELGIGTNPGSSIIGCTIIDEKLKGTCHFANGSNKWFGGDIMAIVHLDHVVKAPTIYIDGEQLDY